MKRTLFAKLLFLALPFAAFFSLPAYVLVKSGEFLAADKLLRLHDNDSASLIGPAYSDPARYLKMHATLTRKPRLLVLGSSRVMQIRSSFTRRDAGFYNAGGGAGNLWELRAFLKMIPETDQPTLLIVGLDQYFFNENWTDFGRGDSIGDYKSGISPLACLYANSIQIWSKFFSGVISLSRLDACYHCYGLNAVMKNNGFRADGSYLYGDVVTHPTSIEERYRDTYRRIEAGNRRFETGTEVSSAALAELDRLFAVCERRHVHVVAFLPPFPHAVFDTLKSKGAGYQYMSGLYSSLKPIADQRGVTLCDFSDLAVLGASDAETIDGLHGSEKAYLRVLIRLAQADSLLTEYCDTLEMAALLKSSVSDLQVE